MGFIGIRISGLHKVQPGVLTMTYRHRDYGSGRLFVDESTLQPLDKQFKVVSKYPGELDQVHSDFPGMQINRSKDIGDSGDGTVRYILQWETLGANHDRPRQPPLPPPTMLRLYKLTEQGP